jgi:hypothetical protein
MIPSEEDRDQYDDVAGGLGELVSEHVQLHQDVIEIDEQTWAIHGYIAYEGDVIAATLLAQMTLGPDCRVCKRSKATTPHEASGNLRASVIGEQMKQVPGHSGRNLCCVGLVVGRDERVRRSREG